MAEPGGQGILARQRQLVDGVGGQLTGDSSGTRGGQQWHWEYLIYCWREWLGRGVGWMASDGMGGWLTGDVNDRQMTVVQATHGVPIVPTFQMFACNIA